MGVTNSFDPRQNIMGGARYLQVLARRFCHTPAATDDSKRPGERLTVCSPDEKIKVIAGYHAGPGAVEKYGGDPALRDHPPVRRHGHAPLRAIPDRGRRRRALKRNLKNSRTPAASRGSG